MYSTIFKALKINIFDHFQYFLLYIILYTNSKNLRPTWTGKRRFFVRDKGIAKQFQRTKKCGVTKTCRGRSPNTFLWSPSPEGAKRLPYVVRRFLPHDYNYILH